MVKNEKPEKPSKKPLYYYYVIAFMIAECDPGAAAGPGRNQGSGIQ